MWQIDNCPPIVGCYRPWHYVPDDMTVWECGRHSSNVWGVFWSVVHIIQRGQYTIHTLYQLILPPYTCSLQPALSGAYCSDRGDSVQCRQWWISDEVLTSEQELQGNAAPGPSISCPHPGRSRRIEIHLINGYQSIGKVITKCRQHTFTPGGKYCRTHTLWYRSPTTNESFGWSKNKRPLIIQRIIASTVANGHHICKWQFVINIVYFSPVYQSSGATF